MLVVALAGIVTLLVSASAAEAMDDTVAELRRSCILAENIETHTDPVEIFESAFCLGFMAGAGTVLQLNCSDDEYTGRFSSSVNTTNGQRVRAFINWADAHPEHWNLKVMFAVTGIVQGLPCRR